MKVVFHCMFLVIFYFQCTQNKYRRANRCTLSSKEYVAAYNTTLPKVFSDFSNCSYHYIISKAIKTNFHNWPPKVKCCLFLPKCFISFYVLPRTLGFGYYYRNIVPFILNSGHSEANEYGKGNCDGYFCCWTA